MNVIIVGCGKVGQKLAERLSIEENHDITVIDLKPGIISDIVGRLDVMGVSGSGASVDTLLEAGIEDADILIAVTGSDELNLLISLIAKKAGNCQTIARIRKPEYRNEIHFLKEDLGLAMIINPEHAAASEIARILKFPSAIYIDTFAKGRVEILKFKIPDDSVLDNMAVSEISSKLGCDILVCGVERGEDAFIPGGNFILHSGDCISIVAALKNTVHFFKKIGIKTNSVRDTIIVGGGNTAYYLAKQLLQTGIKVKIIEQNSERCDELCQLLPKASIINGDGSDSQLLLEEGIESTESFVALTNIDEENVMLSLFARSKTPGKIVTKINRIAFDDVISSLSLDTMIYPKEITAEYIIRYLRAYKNSLGSNIETMHLILGDKAEALEFKITENSPISNIPIQELKLKKGILIACINRGKQVITPRGNDIITKGDNVIIVTIQKGFKDINDILE